MGSTIREECGLEDDHSMLGGISITPATFQLIKMTILLPSFECSYVVKAFVNSVLNSNTCLIDAHDSSSYSELPHSR